MKVTELPIKGLRSYENNAKLHTEDQIAHIMQSILKYGFTQPVVIDESGTVLIGHGRLEAARRLGMKKCPTVVREGLSDVDKAALNLADNKIQQETGFNDKALGEIMRELKAADFPAPDFGLMFKELPADYGNVKNQVDADDSTIKQIVFQMTDADYRQVVAGFERIMAADERMENHTLVFLELLGAHESHRGS